VDDESRTISGRMNLYLNDFVEQAKILKHEDIDIINAITGEMVNFKVIPLCALDSIVNAKPHKIQWILRLQLVLFI